MPNSPANRSDRPTRSRLRSRVVRRILGALIAIGLVVYIASGTYSVQPDERAVVLDFGYLGGNSPNGGDVNESGSVDIDDVQEVVLNFGNVCP